MNIVNFHCHPLDYNFRIYPPSNQISALENDNKIQNFCDRSNPVYLWRGMDAPRRWKQTKKGRMFHEDLSIAAQGFYKIVLSALDLGFTLVGYRGTNETVEYLYKKMSDKIIPFAYLDPRNSNSVRNLDFWITKRKFKGLKLYPGIGYYPDDHRFKAFFKRAEELQIPVLFHSGLNAPNPFLNPKYSHPIYLAALLARYPKLKIVAAHFGHPWFEETLAIAKFNSNLYIDLTCSGHSRMDMIKKAIKTIGPERLVFGTDNPLCSASYFMEVMHQFGRSGIKDSHLNLIFGKNSLDITGVNNNPEE